MAFKRSLGSLKNASRFVLRCDDICDTMKGDNFSRFTDFLTENNLTAVLGVIPENRDRKLMIDPPSKSFWNKIRALEKQGFTIAQHGYTHEYISNDSGILGINARGEFAGIPYEEQVRRLGLGKDILLSQGINPKLFMAPAHSFDHVTLRALKKNGIEKITDGHALFPYVYQGITFVPQLFSSFKNFGFGFYTVCLHLNMLDDERLQRLMAAIYRHRTQILSFDAHSDFLPPSWSSLPMRSLLNLSLKIGRRARRRLL